MGRPHTTKPRSAFARRMIGVREAFALTEGRSDLDQKQFATMLKIGHEAYRRYERGETQSKLATLIKIRNLTGTPLDWLIAGISPHNHMRQP